MIFIHALLFQTNDACQLIADCPANVTEVVFRSLYEGDIVCPHSHLPQHLQTVQAVGSGVGAILAGHIADYYGRFVNEFSFDVVL